MIDEIKALRLIALGKDPFAKYRVEQYASFKVRFRHVTKTRARRRRKTKI